MRLVPAVALGFAFGSAGCQSGPECKASCGPYENSAGATLDALTFTSTIDGAPVDECRGWVYDEIFASRASSSSIQVDCSSAFWSLDLLARGPELSTVGTGTLTFQVDSYSSSYLGHGPSCALPAPSLLEVAISSATGSDPSSPGFRRKGSVHVTASASPTPGDGGICPATSLDLKFEFTLSGGDFLPIKVCSLGC